MAVTHTINKGLTSSQAAPLSASYSQVGTGEVSIDTTLPAASVNTLVAIAFGPAGTSTGNLLSIEITASQNCTISTNGTGTSEVQTLTVTGTPTGGTIPVYFNGAVTTVAFNASAATLQTALQAMTSIGASNVTCTGGPLPGTPIVCTFAAAKANSNQPALLAGSAGLTGGSSPTATFTTTTPGLPQETLSISAGIPVTWDVSGPHAALFAGAVTGFYVTSTNANRIQVRALTA